MVKLIHAATLERTSEYLFLRQKEPKLYAWYVDDGKGNEAETSVSADTVAEAIRLAVRHWRHDGFKALGCGYCFMLPERDEHGMNALFYQMSLSLQTLNGVYFEDDYGYYCSVKQIPSASRELWSKLKAAKRL